MLAAEKGHAEAAGALLKAGADPNLRTQDGETALSIAAQNGHAEIAAMLGG